MTTVDAAVRARGGAPSLWAFALRGAMRRGRLLGLVALPLLVGVVAVVLRATLGPQDRPQAYASLTGGLTVALGLALVGLVLGVSAVNDEREGRTLVLLLSTTTPRWRLVLVKLGAAWLTTLLVLLPAVLGCAVLGAADLPAARVVGAVLLAALLGSGAYASLFVLLSLLSRRGLLIGLAYVLVWEGSLAFLTALRNLSIAAYARRIVAGSFDGRDLTLSTADGPVVVAALVLVAVIVLGAALASWRLARLEVV